MKNIYWFYGNNSIGIQSKVKSWCEAFRTKNPDGADIQKIQAKEIDDFSNFLRIQQTPSLLSLKRIIIICDWVANKKYQKEHLSQLENVCTDNILIFTDQKLPRLPKKLPENLELQEFSNSASNLKKQIQTLCTRHKKSFTPELTQYLVINFSHCSHSLQNETLKAIFTNSNPNITLSDYLPVSMPNLQNTAFEILDNFSKNQTQKTIHAIEQVIKQQGDIYGLWHIIIWQFTTLYKIQRNLTSKEKPFVIKKNQALSKRLSKQQVSRTLAQLCHIDEQIKFGKIQGPKQISQQLIKALYA